MDSEMYGPWPQVYSWNTGGLPNPPKPPNPFMLRMRQALGMNPAGVAMGPEAWNASPGAELMYPAPAWNNTPEMERPMPGAIPMPPPEAPPVAGQVRGSSGNTSAPPANPWASLLTPGQKIEWPKPPELKAPVLGEDPIRKMLLDQLAKGGGGVGRPQMPALPGPPPAPKPIDWSPINEAFEKARPEKYQVDPKEMWLTGLLGALAGFGDARPGERLGITMGRMAGAGAQAGLAERKRQQELERGSKKEQSQFELMKAQNTQNQTLTDVNRQDTADMRNYEHGFKTWGAQMQWLNLQNDIASRNAGLSMQRLNLLAQLAGQDRATSLSLQQMQNEIAAGNWSRAMELAKSQSAQNQQEMMRSLTLMGIVSKDKQGRLGGTDQVSQIGMLIPQVLSGKISVPGLDKVQLNNEALALMPKNYMTLPPKEQEKFFTAAQERVLMQRLQSNPDLLGAMLQVGGGLPMGMFTNSQSSGQQTNPYLGLMNE